MYRGPGFIIPCAPGTEEEELSDDEITSDDFFSSSKDSSDYSALSRSIVEDSRLSCMKHDILTNSSSKLIEDNSNFSVTSIKIEKTIKHGKMETDTNMESSLDDTVNYETESAEEENCSVSSYVEEHVKLVIASPLKNEKVFCYVFFFINLFIYRLICLYQLKLQQKNICRKLYQ